MKHLRELVDVEILQEIQDKFASAADIAVLICDGDGVPLTANSNFTSFCTYIRSSPEGLRRCILSDERVGYRAAETKRPIIHRCHAGLIDFAAPIILRNQYLGAVLCGQVLVEDHEMDSMADMRMELSQLLLDQNELLSRFEMLERKSKKRVEDIAELLFITANYIVKIGDANLAKAELAQKTEKLMEEFQVRAQLEKTLKETQLKALQSQVNPHFLFNTLNTISRIAYLEQAEQTQNVTYILGKILRYSLRNIEQLVSIKEEIEHVSHYLTIQRTRYRDKITVDMDIDNELESYHIPIFTIQPIVENAIIHGFEPIGEPITIKIAIFKENSRIVLTVDDDGAGFPNGASLAQDKKSTGHTSGIGLNNVDNRIKHSFGEEWGIKKLEKGEKGGTRVRVEFPMSEFV
jgi:two-component system, LytTR family, sensor kinase